jgi:hypothetical protein
VPNRHPAEALELAPARSDCVKAPHAASAVALAIVGAQLGLASTDQPLHCHLATGHVTKPRINSPRRPWRRLTVRITSTAPSRRA